MHKSLNSHSGVDILNEVLNEKLLKNLVTLANLNEEDIKILDNGFKFQFERSQRANRLKVISYHQNIIVEFRKVTDNLLEGKMDSLVHEEVIKLNEFSDTFQSVTGIYLDYLG